MLKNKKLMVLIIGLVLFLTANAFGQGNKKRKSIKRVNSVTEYGNTNVGGGVPNKRKRTIKHVNSAQDVFVTEARRKPMAKTTQRSKPTTNRKTIGNKRAITESPWSDDYWAVKNNKSRKTNSKRKRNK